MKIHHLVLIALIVSCASDKKTAKKLTEKGDYEGALEHWALAFKKDPKDEEVIHGFQFCQEKVSNDRLVKIRDLRNSRDEERALLELKSLVELQTKHGMRMDYNSSTFQGKETAHLWRHNRVQLENLIQIHRPLAAEHRQRKFSMVFTSLRDYHAFGANIKTEGAAHCKTIRKGLATRPFYRSFVQQYCQFFSPDRAPGAATKVSITDVLFGEAQVTADISGADSVMTTGLSKSALEGFERSPWFHPEGKKRASIDLSGKFDVDIDTDWITQTHSYEESVPYTEYQTVTKTRQIPYASFENGVQVTKYLSESYTEQEPVTKYRKEKRFHKYQARRKTQDLRLSVKGQIVIEGVKGPYEFTKAESEERILHDEHIPSIGLSPSTKDVTPPSDKFTEYRSLAREALTGDLNNMWVRTYCILPEERDMATMGENITRCRRSPKHPVELVDKWFMNNFGVTAPEAEAIIGKF